MDAAEPLMVDADLVLVGSECRMDRGVLPSPTICHFLLVEMPLLMILRFMGHIHPIGYDTFVVVTMFVAPVLCLSIAFNHIMLGFVVNLVRRRISKIYLLLPQAGASQFCLEEPELKDSLDNLFLSSDIWVVNAIS